MQGTNGKLLEPAGTRGTGNTANPGTGRHRASTAEDTGCDETKDVCPTKLLEKETKYDLEAILRIVFAGRLCTGGRSVVGGGVGDGGVSAERVGVGGGGRCKGAQEALVPFHLSV
jgi:hypothetical protein